MLIFRPKSRFFFQVVVIFLFNKYKKINFRKETAQC